MVSNKRIDKANLAVSFDCNTSGLTMLVLLPMFLRIFSKACSFCILEEADFSLSKAAKSMLASLWLNPN